MHIYPHIHVHIFTMYINDYILDKCPSGEEILENNGEGKV